MSAGLPDVMRTTYDYDVAILSDFRYKGGTSVSVAHEIRAQHALGYRTVLVPLRSSQLQRRRSFHREIVGCVQGRMADLSQPGADLRVRAAVVRPPAVLAEPAEPPLRVHADVTVMIANQVASDATRRRNAPYYDVAAVDRHAKAALGRPLWAPIGPAVRRSLRATGASIDVLDDDWHNLLDTGEWAAERSSFVADRPVIGRHGRPGWKKWPGSADELRAAYPTDGRVLVKILGGGETATQIIGEQPESWTLYPFGSRSPRRFLEEIDFFVYFHHPEVEEAFGRSIAEAMAAGVPVIVAPAFEPLFGDACLYAEPADAAALVAELYADPPRVSEQRAKGRAFVEEHLGFEVHGCRLEALIGPPSTPPRPERRRAAATRVLFVTANGEGMGHLNRLLSLARRAPEGLEPVFATMSPAFRGVREGGFPCEYIPRVPAWTGDVWNPFLMRRLLELVSRYRARAIVLDGSWPFDGLIAAGEASGLPLAWVRRAMWKPGAGLPNLERAAAFSLIVEPGELAADYDRGATVARRGEALRVAPILQLPESELLGREEARRALGLDPGRRAVLVMLGSDDKYGLAATAREIAARCVAEDVQVVFADWLVSDARIELPQAVRRIREYPLSRSFRAFDFAVARPGYNSFHELIACALPTIFVPIETRLDDQHARARWAADQGAGLVLTDVGRCLETMLDAQERERMAERAGALAFENGSQEAVDAIAALAGVPAGVEVRT